MVKVAYQDWMKSLIISGCKRVGNDLIFPEAKTDKEVEAAFTKAGRESSVGLTIGTKAVSDSELAALKAKFPNLGWDTGTVFKCIAANTKLDRDEERFSRQILQLFADQINKETRSVCYQHNVAQRFGIMFGASVTGSDTLGENNLEAHLLIPNKAVVPHQPELNFVEQVKGGYEKWVSIGFRAYGSYAKEMVGDAEIYVYTYLIDPNRPETLRANISEISFVHLGAQQGAAVVKAANIASIEYIKEKYMTTKAVEIDVNGTKHAFTIDVNGEAITTKGEAEIAAAIKAITDERDALKKSVAEFRQPLEADVVNAKLTGFDEATVKALSDSKLIELAKEVTKGSKPEQAKSENYQHSPKEDY